MSCPLCFEDEHVKKTLSQKLPGHQRRLTHITSVHPRKCKQWIYTNKSPCLQIASTQIALINQLECVYFMVNFTDIFFVLCGMSVHVYSNTDTCVWMYDYTCRSQGEASYLLLCGSLPYFLRHGLSLNLELQVSSWLRQASPRNFLISAPSSRAGVTGMK